MKIPLYIMFGISVNCVVGCDGGGDGCGIKGVSSDGDCDDNGVVGV